MACIFCPWNFKLLFWYPILKQINIRLSTITLSILVLSGCTFVPADEGARIRSSEENNAITDAWYPIQSQECQLLVDSFGLVGAAIGSSDTQNLVENMDEIKQNLEMTGEIVTRKLIDLSMTTTESSIREYAIEAIPFFSQLGSLVGGDSVQSEFQIDYLNRMYELTGKVPDACKS